MLKDRYITSQELIDTLQKLDTLGMSFTTNVTTHNVCEHDPVATHIFKAVYEIICILENRGYTVERIDDTWHVQFTYGL